MADTYKIVRFYGRSDLSNKVVKRGLTLKQAQAHCNDPETSSKTCKGAVGKQRTRQCGPWFDGYTKEK